MEALGRIAVVSIVLVVLILLTRCVACAPAQEGAGRASTDSAASAGAGPGQEAALEPYDARFDGLVEDGVPISSELARYLSASAFGFADDPTELFQWDLLASGCEIVALCDVLQSMGIDVEPIEIVDDYLIVDGDYEFGYLASPYDENGGGFPPGIVAAANAYLEDQGSSYRAYDATGSSFDALEALVDSGLPVVVWTTLGLEDPDYNPELGGIDEWYVNEHCVALFGAGDDTVLVSDPLQGIIEEDRELFAEIYEACGSMALYVRPANAV